MGKMILSSFADSVPASCTCMQIGSILSGRNCEIGSSTQDGNVAIERLPALESIATASSLAHLDCNSTPQPSQKNMP